MTTYPDPSFTKGFGEEMPKEALETVDATNKPGNRPALESQLKVEAVYDVYANGKPYRGSGKLEGKSAWISGGDSGLGRATAILFAYEGADSTIVYLPAEQKDAEWVRDYVKEKTGRKISLYPADLKEEKNVIAAIDAHVKEFGKLDILVNNSAQQLENTDITTLDSKQWEDCFQLNSHSYFYASKAAVPHMPKGSSIINMCSINAFIGMPKLLDYTSTKGALLAFTRALSNQLLSADKAIRVNAIAPGPVWTPLVPSTFSKESLAGLGSTPMKRPGQPVEVATVAVFLASEDSSFISGNTIHPNGGTVIA